MLGEKVGNGDGEVALQPIGAVCEKPKRQSGAQRE